jgi:hypothetical protein
LLFPRQTGKSLLSSASRFFCNSCMASIPATDADGSQSPGYSSNIGDLSSSAVVRPLLFIGIFLRGPDFDFHDSHLRMVVDATLKSTYIRHPTMVCYSQFYFMIRTGIMSTKGMVDQNICNTHDFPPSRRNHSEADRTVPPAIST